MSLMPKSWRVNAAFYKGRFNMFNNDFERARQELNLALSLCHKDYKANQEAILKYLIPVEMNKGNYPTQEILKEFNLEKLYGGIVTACINGDLKMLEAQLL